MGQMQARPALSNNSILLSFHDQLITYAISLVIIKGLNMFLVPVIYSFLHFGPSNFFCCEVILVIYTFFVLIFVTFVFFLTHFVTLF